MKETAAQERTAAPYASTTGMSELRKGIIASALTLATGFALIGGYDVYEERQSEVAACQVRDHDACGADQRCALAGRHDGHDCELGSEDCTEVCVPNPHRRRG